MMNKIKKNTFVQLKDGVTICPYYHKLFTISAFARLKSPDTFNQDIGEAIARARVAEIMRHLPDDLDNRLIKIGHDIYNSFNRTKSQPIKFSCSDWEGDATVSSATVCKKCGREKWEH